MYCANNPINYTDPSGHWVTSVGIKAEAAIGFGLYCILSFNRDSTHTSITWTEGFKVISNVGASVSLIVTHNESGDVSDLRGKNFSFGTSYSVGGIVFSACGSVSISKGGTVTKSVGASAGKWASPVSIEAEWGKTKQKYKWKISKMSTNLKKHKVKGYSFNRKNMGSYIRHKIEKGKIQVNVYEKGKVKVKKY